MKDNIENEINIGDYVFCYSGKFKNSVQIVTGFRYCNGEALNGVTKAVNLGKGHWLSNTSVVSINALGGDVSSIGKEKPQEKCDALGNILHIGDRVLFLHAREFLTEVGIVKKLSPKTCLLSIKRNRFGQEEYKKKYEEIISLTAIGYDKEIEHPSRLF